MIRLMLPLVLALPGVALAGDPLVFGDEYGDDGIFELDGPGLESDDGAFIPPENETFRPAIVNGSLVPEGQYVEVVHLGMRAASGGGNCTGSLINKDWVLTAGHCFADDTSGIEVTFGTTANASRKVEAAEWIIHQGWRPSNATNGTFNNDIAVIRLSTPVEDVFPMALNEDPINDDWIDTPITFIGFGITRTGASDSGIKRVASVPLTGYERDRIFAFNGNQSTCQGDSGGPGTVFVGSAYAQVSITSYGAVPCGAGRTGHMRVDHFMPWLRQQGVEFSTRPGAPPSFKCSRELEPENPSTIAIGVVPFDLKCELDYTLLDEVTDVEWVWGDGNTSNGTRVEHEYTTSGNFNVRMCATLERDDGTSRPCVSRNGYVRACAVPTPEFTAEAVEGLQWRLVNLTDVSTYGCISNIQWDIFDESGELVDSVQSWEPVVEFPSTGTYEVVLNVGGLAGTGAASLTLDVKRGLGCDATTAGASSLGGLGMLLGLVALARRRRS
jgi:uncharacterized protein (TIGR03382 family)